MALGKIAQEIIFSAPGFVAGNVHDALIELYNAIVVVANIWQKVGNVISPKNDGDTLNMLSGSEETTAGEDMRKDLGDDDGATVFQIRNFSKAAKIFFNSLGSKISGIGINTISTISNASGVVKVKLSSVGVSIFNIGILINGRVFEKATDAGAADYNPSALTTDYNVRVNNIAAARNIIISTEDVESGTPTKLRRFKFKDYYRNADVNSITISLENGGTIEGQASIVLNTKGKSRYIALDGSNGFID
jgi:hypothetical protein